MLGEFGPVDPRKTKEALAARKPAARARATTDRPAGKGKQAAAGEGE